MLLPQYSHVIVISPNFGAIGAAQLGHFREVAAEGAVTGSMAGGQSYPLGNIRFSHLRSAGIEPRQFSVRYPGVVLREPLEIDERGLG